MDYNICIRQNQLQNFQQFIDSAKHNLNSILDAIGWTENEVRKDDNLVICSFDKTHRVSPKNIQEHLKNCLMRKLGYNIDDVQLSEPVNKPSSSSITIDNATKEHLFEKGRQKFKDFKSGWNGKDPDPKTADRLLSTFSTDERLALYRYAISKTEGPEIPPEFNLSQQSMDDKELSYEERLEHERNMKRRRIKYKSVHTNHKNYNEEIREVISNQMELLKAVNSVKQLHDPESRSPSRQRSKSRSRSPKISKQDSEEKLNNRNGSHDELRSVGSRYSSHSRSSSHHKLRCRSRRRSSDYRDRERDRSHEHRRDTYREKRRYEEGRESPVYFSRNSREPSRGDYRNDRKSRSRNSYDREPDRRDKDKYHKDYYNKDKYERKHYHDDRRKHYRNDHQESRDREMKKRRVSCDNYNRRSYDRR
ncbi:U11/U12 small nuclear ribonucleoprotein 48 kDa protein-like [Atheta coriaria]|uniref:U11/U12 small nuclear ribonucleoprotein 48 kDa protein-like n=1 Tax=Dalotia coriaria TaxID=877792 RepID=UPI0031F46806